MEKHIGDVIVQKVRIISTNCHVYSVYEPEVRTEKHPYGIHQTVTSFGGKPYGQIGSRRIPAEIDEIPGKTDERSQAVRAWYAAQQEEAYAIIISAFPEAATGKRGYGDIEVYE